MIDLFSYKTPTAEKQTVAPRLEHLPAAALFSAFRLDLPVKYMLFRSFRTGVLQDKAEALYRKHITARTGGREPPDYDGTPATKESVDDYIVSACMLHAAMGANGYNPSFAVAFGRKNLPLNGAHRIACAQSLSLTVPVRRCPEDGYPWDFKWFVDNDFTKDELSLILKEYTLITAERTVLFVLWGPALSFWQDLTMEIGTEFQIAGHLDFAFGMGESAAFSSLVYDIYSYEIYDHLEGMAHIDRKLGFLSKAPAFYRVIVASLPPGSVDNPWERARRVKDRVRAAIASKIKLDQYVTCHASESVGETLHMAHTLLDPSNLAALRRRRSAKPRTEFLKWLGEYSDMLATMKISREDCCIVGSSSLEIAEIRQSTDIDFTVRKKVREELFSSDSLGIGSQLDIVREGYHRLHQGEFYADDRLIDDPALHIRFRGFKFASLKIVQDRKLHSARPKDLLDVELIDRYLAGRKCL